MRSAVRRQQARLRRAARRRYEARRRLAEVAELLRELLEPRDPLLVDGLVLDQFVKAHGDHDQSKTLQERTAGGQRKTRDEEGSTDTERVTRVPVQLICGVC